MNKEFLYTLLDNMSVSSHEIPLQKKLLAEFLCTIDENTDLNPFSGSLTA